MLPRSAASLVSFLSSHPTSDVALWNSLLSSLSRAGLFRPVISLFARRMLPHLLPDHFTLAILSKAAAELVDPAAGAALHSLSARLGLTSDTVLVNSLMLLYSRCGLHRHVCQLFDEMPMRSVASWNTVMSSISQLADSSDDEEIWDLVRRMQRAGMKLDGFTISVVLPLCDARKIGQLRGREVHGFLVRNQLGSGPEFHVGSCLIDMYCKGGWVELGRKVLDQMIARNVVNWTAMIGGYVENREFVEALKVFQEMQLKDGIEPNRITLITILPAVGSLACLAEGKQIHCYSFRFQSSDEASLNNALIDMYSKCGRLDYARRVFDDDSWSKDSISWSSIISSYGIHGKGEEAVALFSEMCTHGIKLNSVIGLAVLSACCRAGLVAKGLEIYSMLVKDHGVLPNIEMCSCMVNLLGRDGQLSHALEFIKSMKIPPSPSVWGALFDASVLHNNQEMQDLAYISLLRMEQENPSNFVSLSNLHASSGRWDVVEKVRTRMKEGGLRKMPGCSWLNVSSCKLPSC